MKKSQLLVITMLFPFLCVWTAWIMTAMSFSIQDVFQHEAFWGLSLFYYVLIVWIPLGLIYDLHKEG